MSKYYSEVTVISNDTITPNMHRVTLRGEDLVSFPDDCEGGYIKFLFNKQGGTDISECIQAEQRPVMRTYTIRSYNKNQGQIDVDFVRHEIDDHSCGFAARWAQNVRAGETINIAGPGLIQSLNLEADWFALAADMTALPALTAKIKQLPKNAKGFAVIKVLTEEDIQPLSAPDGMTVVWLTEGQYLSEQVRSMPWLEGTVSVWTACEFDDMRDLRNYFRNEKDVDRNNIYISSYWKSGVTEDGHKVIKRQDMEDQKALADA
ncbi:NADPH-dependent ferric siderophore reductase [Veronia nyctiphanis]|uniref:NADPH-dependent ferric siderophore reductase n=1 Tax=Veronia nyctiphanis TaxID=1278244 RepID=A0A4Q0YSL6_9GAMM|nr:siderophore-interacting protein [Veronia nyctiphanis]RXJ74230.1 NADPH-dependent ferric siderophore reductase [Veronia nyctiphanis]